MSQFEAPKFATKYSLLFTLIEVKSAHSEVARYLTPSMLLR